MHLFNPFRYENYLFILKRLVAINYTFKSYPRDAQIPKCTYSLPADGPWGLVPGDHLNKKNTKKLF